MTKESAVTRSWRERAQAAETLTTAYERVLGAVAMGEKPFAVETDKDGSTFALWFPTAPDGGVLVRTFRHSGQRPIVRASLFEAEYSAMTGAWRLGIREALSALRQAQYRALNETAA